MEQITEYRLNQHERSIEELHRHHEELNKSISLLLDSLRDTNESIKNLQQINNELREKIKTFEYDLNSRAVKTSFFKSLMNYWPLLLLGLYVLSFLDHQKIASILTKL